MELLFKAEILRRKEEKGIQKLIMKTAIMHKVVTMGQTLSSVPQNNHEKHTDFMDRKTEA